MNAPITHSSQTAPAVDEASPAYWQRVDHYLDQHIAQTLSGDMPRYLRDDLLERLPRQNGVAYRSGTVFDATVAAPILAKMEERLTAALTGQPQPQDQQAYKRSYCPQYDAFLRTERSEPAHQRTRAAFTRYMLQAATAYTHYTRLMAEHSFPDSRTSHHFVNTTPAQDPRVLRAAIETPLLRAYGCMEMLDPSPDTAVLGLTENRIALMQAFDFMKDIAESSMREILTHAPMAAPPKPEPAAKPRSTLFTASAPRTIEQIRRDLEEANPRPTEPSPAAAATKKSWFSR